MKSVEKIKCHECGAEIDVNTALSNEIETKLKTEFIIQNQKHLEEIERLQKENKEIGLAIAQEKEKEYKQLIESEREKIKTELDKESEDRIKLLENTLKEKSEQVKELNKTKAEIEKLKLEKEEIKSSITAEKEAELSTKLKEYDIQNQKHLIEIEKLQREKTEIGISISKEKDEEHKRLFESERVKIKTELDKESEERLKLLENSLKEKSEQVKELHKSKAEIERLKLEKEEIELKITAEKEADLSKKLKEVRDSHKELLETEIIKIKKELTEENTLTIEELKKKLKDQNDLVEEMKRKSEQGSMQLQGEVQELAIEDILRDSFRFDVIESVPKGISGADVIQRVRNKVGNEVGIIVYESKRTKAFGKEWINKLKDDGSRVKADICVLVTEALPDGIEKIGQKDGVWVCTFHEFRGLALVLRDSVIKISEAYSSQTNKGEKMQMLYDYLMGKEFSSHVKSIIEGFNELQKGYLDERNRMEKIWKTRGKQLEKILLNTNSFVGSIVGIAGSSLLEIPMIEDRRDGILPME
ncbi:MAG: DUF2130 domain-containing protein [Candidatus Cloacimonetes bacterium]|nr:DUF2130 domain-containing protein [Candidatus Cloacimonadota bacterium]